MSFCDHLRSVIVSPNTPLNDFSSETPGPIIFKPNVASSVKLGSKIYTRLSRSINQDGRHAHIW